ncbi:hypothetical protein PCANC_19670 [Puccinia coronata f. sp. avenae]|uniref:Uncharacterized protein n=1 Tax=Puccinia coronata f. sp. avenae TaxID=200324 RepID=A0A2N5SAV7_9BASI|nr:hypothetical protein PCANC_19670 [Puccinia coronata f. sp. avenae]
MVMTGTSSAPEAEVNKFMRRVFIVPMHQKCREHGVHQELSIVVPLGNGEGAKSILYRIAENRRKFYLSKKVLNLRTEILPSRPEQADGSRRPLWVFEVDRHPALRDKLAALILQAFTAVLPSTLQENQNRIATTYPERAEEYSPVLSDRICSQEWVLCFIELLLQHPDLRGGQGRLGELTRTINSQNFSS